MTEAEAIGTMTAVIDRAVHPTYSDGSIGYALWIIAACAVLALAIVVARVWLRFFFWLLRQVGLWGGGL